MNDPTDGRGGVSEAVAALRQTSFLRVMLILAATVVVLVGIRLSAPILNPIFFAVVLTLLFSPIYSWLKRRGLPSPLALVIMLVVIAAIFVALFFILGVSISKFSERVGFYTSQLNSQLVDLDALLERLGLSNVDLRDVIKPSALTDVLGTILSGIAGFLSDLFLILVIMLFLLAEGPAMMDRLRAGTSGDNPQVERLTTILAENVLSPMMMGRGLNISPTIVFLSFVFWAWLLGGPGAFLALPITLFVAVMFDTFPETRWLASLIGVADVNSSAVNGNTPGATTQGGEVEHSS